MVDLAAFQQWINHALAAYFEDIADAEQGRNFGRDELLSLGAHAATVAANITDNFLKLSPADRESLIERMQQ